MLNESKKFFVFRAVFRYVYRLPDEVVVVMVLVVVVIKVGLVGDWLVDHVITHATVFILTTFCYMESKEDSFYRTDRHLDAKKNT